ncbi:pilus (MSHA type) biogenesis protein MshL [Bacterioplanoides sp.]|uniref:pilus (MSHA type) biogenesis protein MshL n=1 Tax=Bacterioplanoides sp. TaxID=2066072 RepID=UPI003B003D09
MKTVIIASLTQLCAALRTARLYLTVSFLCLLLSACATPTSRLEADKKALHQNTPAQPLLTAEPQPRTANVFNPEQLLPSLTDDDELSEKRFDVLARKVPAQTFFNSLVQGTDQNLVVHPQVSGEISLNIKNVTLLEALNAVRDIYGFDFVMSQYGIQILPSLQQTRIYPINYLNVKRSGNSGMRVSSGQVSSTTSNSNSSNSSSTETETNTLNVSQVETESGADFWTNLRTTLELMTSSEKDSQVVVDAHAGIVIVKGQPNTLNMIEKYLERAELSVQKQVLIEAKIVEVTLNDGFQAGINWNTLSARTDNNSWDTSLSSVPLLNPDRIGGIFSLDFSVGDFSGALQLLQTQGEVKVLSSPRIATVNNQKAVIKVGTDEFFVTEVSNSTTTSSTGTTDAPEIELTPFFSGIALDVTPQVGERDEVILHVHPTVTEVEERVKVIELGDDDFTLPLAFSRVRETDSIVKARSGQIVVIGGLIQQRKETTTASVPVLGDIPGLGWLFRQERETIRESELVILLQPRVVGSGLSDQQIQYLNDRYSQVMLQEG